MRYREIAWSADGARIVYVDDAEGFERIATAAVDRSEPARYLTSEDIGRVVALAASPATGAVAFSNHRHELAIVRDGVVHAVDRSPASKIEALAFSPDGRYLAYDMVAAQRHDDPARRRGRERNDRRRHRALAHRRTTGVGPGG